MYRRRNAGERCVGWLEEDRRPATRYEKPAVSYPAVAHVCMIRLYLRRITGLSDRT
jgi:transposase